jgi:AbrB family looped-hinge helix DNA binding protein
MHITTLTISSKGQIVLPKKIRNILGTNTISLEVNDQNHVVISPVLYLGGALSSYQQDSSLSFDEIREQAWKANTNVITSKGAK